MRALIAAAALGLLPAVAVAAAPAASGFKIPIAVKKLPNGLTVVVSEDHSAPTFGISTAYRRRLPARAERPHRLRAPLRAHDVRRHAVPPKGTLDARDRGRRRRHQRLHPQRLHELHRTRRRSRRSTPILWLEADRMKTLDFSDKNLKNQQEVVKEEIRVNVKNRPYGALLLDRPRPARPSTSGRTTTTATARSRTSTPPASRTSRASSTTTTARTTPCSAIVGDVTPDEVLREGGEVLRRAARRAQRRRARTSPRA